MCQMITVKTTVRCLIWQNVLVSSCDIVACQLHAMLIMSLDHCQVGLHYCKVCGNTAPDVLATPQDG